jgi:N12 class adenine-specific DNA methylase
MPSKLQNVVNIYNETLSDMSKSPENWASFLITASNNYKYNFAEQVLIFVQRPDATACADIDTWNSKVKRWVNKGAKGIALLEEINGYNRLRHVFDVSDTHNYRGTKLNLWQVNENYHNEIIETLEARFGELENKSNLAQAIISASYNSVEDNLPDYLRDLITSKDNSLLEELDDFNIEVSFRILLSNSVAYMTMQRCGINPFDYFSLDDFRGIVDFNTLDTISVLGAATSDIAETNLREIHQAIRNLQIQEKNKNHTFVEKEKINDNIIKESERSVDYGNNIQRNRGLPNTQFNDRENERESSSGQILSNEVKLSERAQKRSIYGFNDEKRTYKSSSRNSKISNRKNRNDNKGLNEERKYYRGFESTRPNEMGTKDEQFEEYSGGDSNSRTNLQLNLISEEQQKQKIADMSNNDVPAIFEFTQEMIDRTLQNGSNFEYGKFRIYQQMTSSLSSKENIDFLKKEYGMGGSSSAYSGADFGQQHDAKGILLYKGYKDNRPERLLTWSYVEKRLRELVLNDRYLNTKEFDEYLVWLDNDTKEKISSIKEIPVEKVLDYHLGDIVYIGSDSYEISNIGIMNVQLYDLKFPLLGREMSIEDFERVIKENPSNSHLIKFKEISENEIVNNEFNENYKLSNDKYFHFHTSEEGYYYEIYDNKGQTVDGGILEYSDIDNTNQSVRDIRKRLAEFSGFTELLNDNLQSVTQDFIDNLENNEIVEEIKVEPSFDKTVKEKVTFNTMPQITSENRINYKIINDNLGVGSPREKFENNIEAIKVLKKCENENRLATPEEQEILSKYVGWGGLAKAFDEKDTNWSNEYNILKDLLSEEEYKNARASTLTAFYTPPIVIKAMYKALENLGVKNANILEPSCGIGNFLGSIPDTMNESKLYGIELDSISGRIARQLYQKSNIVINGYEKVDLPDSFFDVSIGNVPFGDFKVNDKRYDKNNFLIHDYFFGKTLDKVRPGGIVAFITSKGTMDKENPSIRKYIAQRADLLGAIRLPNNTFSKNAGTEVTSDILFLQKRENMTSIEPDWVYLDTDSNGIKMNKYFVDNPDMILGNMEMKTTQYGLDSTCTPNNDLSLENQLDYAITNIHGEISEYEIDDIEEDDKFINADPNVRNFSYTIVDGQVYFRENSKMYLQELPVTSANRIKGMIELRDCVRTLIDMQTEDYPDENIKQEQLRLNRLYDKFVKQYGLINSRGNNLAFSEDSSYFLLCSLEVLDGEGKFVRKADMFSKRTINPYREIKDVSISDEALIVSMSEKAKVDLDYMSELTKKDKDTIIKELEGVIYEDPLQRGTFYTADEYLSGNVREKLKIAEGFALTHPEFQINVDSLKKVMPKDIQANEIGIKLGSTWIPEEIIRQFMFELLDTPTYLTWDMKVRYSKYNSEWYIENKNRDRNNIKAYKTYGTDRINAYKIIETTLNLKDVKIFDTIIDEEGRKTRVLNKKETAIAQSKQEQIKTEFEEWVWKDPNRREKLVKLYNEKFNSIRPREYDGSNLNFVGMNPEIKLRPHQVNAIAHVLYGGNTLLAHEVGAGKTFEMVAAAMESKRLGLCNKSLFVVPNHIIEQFASEFLQLYPSANILVATKKDFQTANRKKFCSRIATGDYDAVIIGHSQFEKIPMSIERQTEMLEKQINDILNGIDEVKRNHGENFTIKQLEKTRKGLENKLEKLNNQTNKDDVITFEQLGVDKLFVDEAHNFKNLFLYTKMRNVGGIAQTEAQKSSDIYMKCRYLDEITGGKGTVFATGTPVSNSMVELYTMQRYLQYNGLEKMGLEFFDSWASTFGETVTAIELSPEGTGYRAKTRFAKFHNLPELMNLFKEIADIQTADTLNLPVPEAIYKNIVTKPSQIQKDMVEELGNRAERIRNGMVDASVDNMLKITNEGRKLALDQRIMNDMLEDDPNSKVNTCINNIYDIWNKTKENKSSQLVFCDLSTPKQNEELFDENGNYKFTDIYNDIRRKLSLKGIPREEIAFIHEADNEVKKKELFAKVRNGDVRVLIGSTSKMGAGTNVQDKLVALHHLDCPWRPADLTQRNGRGIRQGNQNEQIEVYTYVTEGTFDAYLYQLVENKQKFISQIMTSKTPVRVAEDVDEKALSYGEIKALATGNPDILEKTELDTAVAKLKLLKQSFMGQKYDLQDRIAKYYPKEIKRLEDKIIALEKDIKHLEENTKLNENEFSPMTINDITYNDKAKAGQAILDVCHNKRNADLEHIGNYRGFDLELEYNRFDKVFNLKIKNEYSYYINLGSDIHGNIQRIDNCLEKISEKIQPTKEELENEKVQLSNAEKEAQKEFPQEHELQEKQKRLDELNIKLNLNEKELELLDNEIDEDKSQSCKNDRER